jgi:hypothetical protein
MKASRNKLAPRSRRAKIRATLLAGWYAGFALAALALSPPGLFAGVIDDFNGAQPKWDGWNAPAAPSEPAALAELPGQRLRIAANFTTATSPASPLAHFGNVYYSTNLPLRQRQTLELRADLVSASQDNLFACLVTMDTKGGEYVLFKDRNELALLKWSQSDGLSVAFWETRTIQNGNVVLVLTLTPLANDVMIETKVISKSGVVLFVPGGGVDGVAGAVVMRAVGSRRGHGGGE